MKKFFTLLLLCALLTSCGSETAVSKDTTAADTASTETKDDDFTKYGYVAPDIPAGVDYGGQEFMITYPAWSNYNTYFWAESANGDVVNDACYKRLITAEEKLNIDIQWYSFGSVNDMQTFVEKTVTAGVDDYDLLMTHNYVGCIGILTSGCLMNWYDIPTVDFSKPYYNTAIIERFTFDGVLPYLSSDLELPDINAIFFNTNMVESYNMENPYTCVKEGKWTIDKMAEFAKIATRDLNGDGQFDDQDQYGFAGENGWQIVSIVTAGSQPIVERNGDTLRIAVKDERCIEIVDKMRSFMYQSGNAYVWKRTDANDPNWGGTPPVNFADGKTLFYQAPLSYFPYMRSSEVDFGVLPYPKYDEAQQNYECLNWAGYLAVMQTAKDPSMTGYVVEVLSAESCRTVMPAFYNELLSEKIARDPDAVEVLDMMFNNTVCDLGIVTRTFSMLSSPFADSSLGYVSHVESNIATFEKSVADYIAGCEALKK